MVPSLMLNMFGLFPHPTQMPVAGRDREAQAVIEALKEVYRTKLKPIEERSKFDQVCAVMFLSPKQL